MLGPFRGDDCRNALVPYRGSASLSRVPVLPWGKAHSLLTIVLDLGSGEGFWHSLVATHRKRGWRCPVAGLFLPSAAEIIPLQVPEGLQFDTKLILQSCSIGCFQF